MDLHVAPRSSGANAARRKFRMGCGVSKKAGDPGPPPHLQAATARTVRLLESLAAKEERVEQPVLPNSERLRSVRRPASSSV